jgi:hypothetical protein
VPFKNPALLVLGPGDQSVELGNNPLTGAPQVRMSTGATTETQPALLGVSAAAVNDPLYLDISGPVHSFWDPSAPTIRLSTFGSALPAGGRYINFFSDHLRTDQPLTLNDTWTPLVLAGTWVGTVEYLVDAANNVHLRGLASGGAAVTIATLPAALWPTQTVEFSCKGGAGVGATVAFNISTAGQMLVLTNLASATARMPLDMVTYSLF